MTNLLKFVTSLDGWPGGPGVNVSYFSQGSHVLLDSGAAQDAYDELHSFYANNPSHWRTPVRIIVDRNPSVVDVESGKIIDVLSVGTVDDDLVGSGTGGSLPQSTVLCMRLSTDRFLNGRRLNGRWFLGPVPATVLGDDGNVKDEIINAQEGAMAAMTSGIGVSLAVYSRPGPRNNSIGQYADVVNVTCLKKPTNLRSRRD